MPAHTYMSFDGFCIKSNRLHRWLC